MNNDPSQGSQPTGDMFGADVDAIAWEYVLGTLSLTQRQQVEWRLATDTALRECVAQWEVRLLPLTGLAEPLEPAPALWLRIENSVESLGSSSTRALAIAAYEAVSAEAPPSQEEPASRSSHTPRAADGALRQRHAPSPGPLWRQWWHSVVLWRGLAGTGFAAAAVLAAVLLLSSPLAPANAGYLVVLVAPSNQSVGWIVQAKTPNQLELIPAGTAPAAALPADKALQFWTKAEGWSKPLSLGLVTPGQSLRIPLESLPPLQPNQLFELTIEPAGGSPTQLPTGPIQFIGRAVKVSA